MTPSQPRRVCGLMADGDASGVHHRGCHRERSHPGPCAHRPRTWTPTGIDVEKLTKAADEVLTLTRADDLARLAVATRDAALAKQRRKYRKRWGQFFACELCGDRPCGFIPDRCTKCDGELIQHRRDQ